MSKGTSPEPGYDFRGWATKADVRCTDGRIIEKDAFAHCDGKEVSLAWNHNNTSPFDILGKVRLENRPQGLYAFGYFNDTEAGETAKKLVQHGDIGSMSICATNVRENGHHVYFGNIKEVSLVQSGANKEAVIEYVLQHSDESEPSMFMFALGDDLCEFRHSDDGEPDDDDEEEKKKSKSEEDDDEDEDSDKDDVDNILSKMSPEQKKKMLSKLSGKEIAHSDEGEEDTESGEDEGTDPDADLSEEEVMKLFEDLPQEKKDVIFAFVNKVIFDDTVKHSEYDPYDPNNLAEIAHLLPDLDGPHRQAVVQVVGYSFQHRDEILDQILHSADDDNVVEGDDDMKYNPFEGTQTNEMNENAFTHSDFSAAVKFASSNGARFSKALDTYCQENGKSISFKHDGDDPIVEPVVNPVVNPYATQYAETTQNYGTNGTDFLFPNAKLLNNTPIFIKRDTEWVAEVFNKANKAPTKRVKSIFANITEDEARAKGYVKGNQKFPEVFPLLKRETVPTTLYKMQKFDRDDVLDIEDFNYVQWIREEMMIMFREELSRAILIGDGRQAVSPDKIDETKIRPIWTDEDLYTYKKVITPGANDAETAEKFIEACVRARKYYKGSGNLTLFTTEDLFTDMLLLKDKIGRRYYNSTSDLNLALRVVKTVTVPVMEGLTRNGNTLAGILVNMQDYTIGVDNKSRTTWFDDFDIDFNQYKYLVEARMCGTLTVPYSAIVIEVGNN